MRVESEQLGTFEVAEDSVITFPYGIPGFLDARQFCILETTAGCRFKLLQNLEEANLAFVVTDPLVEDEAYPLARVQELAEPLGIKGSEPVAVLSIVTVPAPPAAPTVNLLAPLAIGPKTRLGMQVILHDSKYEMRHPVRQLEAPED